MLTRDSLIDQIAAPHHQHLIDWSLAVVLVRRFLVRACLQGSIGGCCRPDVAVQLRVALVKWEYYRGC
jgi:hypothetical protein